MIKRFEMTVFVCGISHNIDKIFVNYEKPPFESPFPFDINEAGAFLNEKKTQVNKSSSPALSTAQPSTISHRNNLNNHEFNVSSVIRAD